MTQQPDTAPGNYYVSCRREDGKTICLAGPFRDDHAKALELRDAAAQLAINSNDPRAPWYSYGTLRTSYEFSSPGIFNVQLGIDLIEAPVVVARYEDGPFCGDPNCKLKCDNPKDCIPQ